MYRKVIIELFLIFMIASLCYALYRAPKQITLYNNTYLSNASYIDLSTSDISNLDELYSNLNLFTNLRKLKFKDLSISYEDKEILESKNIEVDTISYIELNNNKYREDEDILELSINDIDDELINNLKKFKDLKIINLTNSKLSIDNLLKVKEELPNVEIDTLVNILGEVVPTNVTSLDLSNRKVTNKEAFVNSLKLLYNLKDLYMGDSNLSNEELDSIRTMLPNTKVTWIIHFGKWSVRTDSVAFSVWITDYNYVRLTSKDIEVLKYCTDLQALDLGHQNIDDITIIGKYLTDLRILILADNKISDISPLSSLKHLHYIELFMNKITDISPLRSCKELVDFNIGYNYKFEDITPLLDLPLLERIWIVSTKNKVANAKILKERFPNAKISIYGVGSTDGGWRSHPRYRAMIDMFRKRDYISEEFSKYDNLEKNDF